MQVSGLNRKPNMVLGTSEVSGRYLNILRDTYSDTTNIEYMLSCTRPSNIVTRVGELHLGAAGRREWLKT